MPRPDPPCDLPAEPLPVLPADLPAPPPGARWSARRSHRLAVWLVPMAVLGLLVLVFPPPPVPGPASPSPAGRPPEAIDVAVGASASASRAPIGVAVAAAPEPGGAPGPPCRRTWASPVDAPVVDPFRPPADPYAPGNRGLEYGTEPGQPVHAVAAGTVRFAGPVGGAPVVVVDHGGGLLSTYVQLLDRSVSPGRPVGRGDRLATAGAGFHLTARLDGRYLDPAVLLERSCVVVRLVVPPDPS